VSGIHPEDAMSYADQLHRDLAAIADELAGLRELLGLLIDGERAVSIRQVGAIIVREDRP